MLTGLSLHNGNPCTGLTDVGCSVTKLLRIKVFTADIMIRRWLVDGYDWVMRIYPKHTSTSDWWVVLNLVLLSNPRRSSVRTTLVCRLVDREGTIQPSELKSQSSSLRRIHDSIAVMLIHRFDLAKSSYLEGDTLTVQCTLTVLKEVSTGPSQRSVCAILQLVRTPHRTPAQRDGSRRHIRRLR
jgi:speckle-type POZ protein